MASFTQGRCLLASSWHGSVAPYPSAPLTRCVPARVCARARVRVRARGRFGGTRRGAGARSRCRGSGARWWGGFGWGPARALNPFHLSARVSSLSFRIFTFHQFRIFTDSLGYLCVLGLQVVVDVLRRESAAAVRHLRSAMQVRPHQDPRAARLRPVARPGAHGRRLTQQAALATARAARGPAWRRRKPARLAAAQSSAGLQA
jgi:hypothetical protein